MMKSKYYDAIGKKYNLSKDKRNIILIGTPNHGNLGDQAIAYAEKEFLKNFFHDKNIAEVCMQDFAVDIDALYYLIKSDDIIVLHGGGNCGNFYMDDEMIRRYVVLRFINNKIILFPQSVYFTDNECGRKERDISSKIYGSNKNFYLIARDAVSEEQLKNYFQNTIYRLPDVVLTLPQWKHQNDKKGVLLCLRNDEEGILDNAQQEQIENILKVRYESVKRTDTVIEYRNESFQREYELKHLLNEIGSAELIVTDRLHGMIFSIITETPCIVMPTFNTKIISSFEELKNIANVVLAHNVDELTDALEKVCLERKTFQNEAILQDYQRVLNEIISRDIVCKDMHNQIDTAKVFDIAGYWSEQHYETEYWKSAIEAEYKKLEDSNEERISEISSYKQWIANLQDQLEQTKNEYQEGLSEKEDETASYKEWVTNLESQLEQVKGDHQRELAVKEDEAASYKEWVKNLNTQIADMKKEYQNVLSSVSEKDKELSAYGEMVVNMKNKIEQLLEEVKNSENELRERERQWNIQQRELYNCIKEERGSTNR